MRKRKCFICGPVRNCAPYLETTLKNAETIGQLFDDYCLFLFYDPSDDDSLSILRRFARECSSGRVVVYENPKELHNHRTHRLAYARNYCLDYMRSHLDLNEYPFFIMMDFDDVNCKTVRTDVLSNYLWREDWDALSFCSLPRYYDIWALSIYPYCFSYAHFKDTYVHNYHVIQQYIHRKLNELKKGELLECISAFNGLSIYRTGVFLSARYDGRPRMDLLPKHLLLAHSLTAKSPLIYHNYGHVKGDEEDCEHRAFHMSAIREHHARIRISRDVLFV